MNRIAAVLILALPCIPALAADNDFAPRSRAAKLADTRRVQAIEKAKKEHDRAVLSAEKAYLGELRQCIQQAMQAGNADETTLLRIELAKAEERAGRMAGEGEIVVQSAIWGPKDHTVDVTSIVMTAFTDGRSLLVDNADMGGDPAPGIPKSLLITYRSGREVKTVSFPIGTTITQKSIP